MLAAGRGERRAEIAVRLWEGLGDILEQRTQHEEALQAYRNAQAQVPHGDRIWQARLHRKAGAVMREQRRYAETLDACRQAEAALDRQPVEDGSHWWAEWIEVQLEQVWAHYWLAQWLEMDNLVNKVQPVVQERGGAASRMRLLMASCLMHLRRDRYTVSDEMLADAREALALGREWGGPKNRIECQFELGFLHLWRRELTEAKENLLATLELAATSGILTLRTLSLTYSTVSCRFRGQTVGVLDSVMRAHEAAQAAHMPDYVAAAKANQAWLASRRQDLPRAQKLGQEALAIWRQSPLVYPFQWQALWPLIGVALAGGREDEAWAYAQALLEPMQQRLPDALNTALTAAVQANAEDQTGAARRQLDRAMALARELGYLWWTPGSHDVWRPAKAQCVQCLAGLRRAFAARRNPVLFFPADSSCQTPGETLCKRWLLYDDF